MISFFKINAVYKLIILILLFLLIRLPALIYEIPVSVPELNWMLVGERMSQGFQLYTEIWDDVSPLSALIFWVFHQFFGRSPLALGIASALLVFLQAWMFNYFLRKREVLTDLTLLPLLLYIVLTACFWDYFTLSPALMANTFLIIVVRYLFIHVGERKKYNAVFEIGAYIGIATLFYLPSFLMLLVVVFSFLLYTSTKFKDYLLMFFSFFFTIGIAFLVFYITNSEYEFYLNFFQSLFYLKPFFYLSIRDLFLLFTIPFVLTIWGTLQFLQYRRYTNYQIRCQRIMIIWLGVAFLTIFLDSKVSAYSFVLTFPAIVFLLSHYFLVSEQTFLKEIVFLLLLFSCLFFNYNNLYGRPLKIPVPFVSSIREIDLSIHTQRLVAKPHPKSELLQGKKILVLGNALENYISSQVASPYLNWRLAQRHLNRMDQYFNIQIQVYHNIFGNHQDIPEAIVDEVGEADFLFKHLPLAAQKYEKIPDSNIYLRTE